MKVYKTNIPTWNQEKGDYSKPAETPETLEKFSLYDSTNAGKLFLFAIGGSMIDNFSSNWDIYVDEKGTLYSIARPGSGCEGTYFGDVSHIRNLIRNGYFDCTLTKHGFDLMKGA